MHPRGGWQNVLARARDNAARIVLAMGCAMAVAGNGLARASTPTFPAPRIDSALVMRAGNGGLEIAGPLGIAVDPARREVIVANTERHRVEFFDLDAWPRGSFVHRVETPGGPRDGLPAWVAVDGEGRVLIGDRLVPYVNVVDHRGRSVARLVPPPPDHELTYGAGPGAIAVAPSGEILVASRGRKGRVHVFAPDGSYLRTWGSPGTAEGELSAITALGVGRDGRVVVACVATEVAVQVFDAQGRYLHGFGRHEIGPGNFSYPSGIAFTGDGRIWVSDAIRQTVQVFDPAGVWLGAVGGPGVRPGEFLYPSALAGDGKGVLALAERAGNRFQVMWVR